MRVFKVSHKGAWGRFFRQSIAQNGKFLLKPFIVFVKQGKSAACVLLVKSHTEVAFLCW